MAYEITSADSAGRLARSGALIGLAVYLMVAVLDTATTASGAVPWLAALAAVGYLLVHGRHAAAPGVERPRLGWTLGAQVGLTYLPVFFGATWLGMGGFLAGAVLITVREPWGVPLFVVVVLAEVGLIWWQGTVSWLTVGDVVAIGLASYALARIPVAIGELRDSGEAPGVLAARERLQIASDVHDTLGRGLTTVALKAELSLRLLGHDRKLAAAEVRGLTEAARAAIADVRRLTRAAARPDLEAEIAAAAVLLASAGTVFQTELAPAELGQEVDALLACAVREGVTNVVRHSRARTCVVVLAAEAGGCRLELTNDGVYAAVAGRGTGLTGLADRAAMLGGRCAAGVRGDGRFRLVVEVPAR